MNEGLREHLLEFARYNTWANRRTADTLDALTGEQVGPLLRLFSHLLRAEAVWLGRLRGTLDSALPIVGDGYAQFLPGAARGQRNTL